MNQLLQQRKYKGLHYEYAEHPMENHNSETAPSMKQVLKTYHF
jgi:hypothetical protein